MEGDFIGDCFSFFSTSEDERSPEVYRTWGALSMLAASLERRVVVRTGRWETFPNLYIFLVGGPGAGKGVISTIRKMMRNARAPGANKETFFINSKDVTKASLIDEMALAKRELMGPDGRTYGYSALYTASEEFGSFMSIHSNELIFFLNDIYNCDDVYDQSRRTTGKKISIENPTYNCIGGVQPGVLGAWPEEHWNSGLARRVLMVFSDEERVIDPFDELQKSRITRCELEDRLGEYGEIQGEINWSKEASDYYRYWLKEKGQEPKPKHSKLMGYNKERPRNVSKLAGLSAISRLGGIKGKIELMDLKRAFFWLEDMEKRLPDIFRAMTGKSDSALIEELWMFVTKEYVLSGRKGVTEDKVVEFVAGRTTSDKVDKMIDLAKRMNRIRQKPLSSLWEPTGKSEHTEE